MTEEEMRAEMARLGRRLERERRARQEAEHLAEKGTRELYERQSELELLNAIADTANGASSLRSALQATLDKICAYTAWPVGHAYFVDEANEVMQPTKIWHLDCPEKFAAFRQVTEETRFRRGEGLPGSVWEKGTPLWISDVASAHNFPRAKQSQQIGVVATFGFPVFVGAAVVAVLEFFSGERVEREEKWLKIAAQTGIQLGRIFERDRAARELERAHREMLDLSRRAGMAEVATGVLHNVGNVLNSVSVSAALIADRLRRSKLANLRAATQMLHQQNGHLADFLTSDPKGKVLPAYLHRATEQLEKDQSCLMAESLSLNENIEHIKGIVSTQQAYAKVTGLEETLDPALLVEDALRMTGSSLERHGIQIVRQFAQTGDVCADRHKVLQILINLIRNAKQAMAEPASPKKLTVGITAAGPRIAISVSDTGTGISPANLKQIFNHGFTTKRDGHGFGLHSGANSAKEMGGSLKAHSDGEGLGATFTLELTAAKATEGVQ